MIPEKTHTKYNNSNFDDVVGFVVSPPKHLRWRVPRKVKVKDYGPHLKCNSAEDLREHDEGLEEWSFSKTSLPCAFYESLYKSHSIVGIIDASVGTGQAAKAALLQRLPFLGFALTESHVASLQDHLIDFIQEQFTDESSPLYRPKAASVLKAGASAEKDAGKDAGQKDAGKKDAGKKEEEEEEEEKGEKNPKKKGKKRKVESSSESESVPAAKRGKKGGKKRKAKSEEDSDCSW